jgi:hypothetical protein
MKRFTGLFGAFQSSCDFLKLSKVDCHLFTLRWRF